MGSLYLKLLEEMILSESSITIGALSSLLKVSPGIKKIALINCQALSGAINLGDLQLKSLEAMILSGSSITTEALSALLKASPHIKKIELVGCKNLSEPCDWANLPFESLEEIALSGHLITTEALNGLFKVNPKIKKIQLMYCKNLSEPIHLEDDLLLEEIILFGVSITKESLKSLLKAAPRLKRLRLGSATGLEFDDELIELLSKVQYLKTTHPGINRWLSQSKEYIATTSFDADSREESFISTEVFRDPIHDSQFYREHKPHDESRPFEYRGKKRTFNQGMIIEQFSQYLILTDQHRALIPNIQDGICVPLSHFFVESTTEDWVWFLWTVWQWNGQKESLNQELSAYFEKLVEYIRNYQFEETSSVKVKPHYLGDDFDRTLLKCASGESHILKNPWHAIAVRRVDEDEWVIYDPNFVNGHKTVSSRELRQTISHALGALISCETLSPDELKIASSNDYLEQGGLLALCQAQNHQAILRALKREGYSQAALEGLLLRDVKGKPAWVWGIQSDISQIQAFSVQLLLQFIEKNPSTFETDLQKSIECLTPLQRQACIESLHSVFSERVEVHSRDDVSPPPSLDALLQVLRQAPPPMAHYQRRFQTWRQTEGETSDVKAFCFSLIGFGEASTKLVELSSDTATLAMQHQLVASVESIGRPVFYVDGPEDLICSSPFLEKNDENTGTIHPGPGGALYDFLRENEHKNPILVVNYNHFKADDIVRFNGLLDDKPHVDGVALPLGAMVIGLINREDPNAYQGSDFYSRFEFRRSCPIAQRDLEAMLPTPTILDGEMVGEEEVSLIELHHGQDWEERLLGRWVLDGNRLMFQEGELLPALEANKPIQIANGLWDNPDFQRFWQRLASTGLRHAGRDLKLPKDIKLIKTQGYDWDRLRKGVLGIHEGFNLESGASLLVLNPGFFNDFLVRYEVDEANQLIRQPGWVEVQASKWQNAPPARLAVNLTRDLSEDAWARLLSVCEQHQVALELHFASGFIPSIPGIEVTPGDEHEAIAIQPHTTLMLTNDIDASVYLLTQDEASSDWVVIDVSDCESHDLLTRLDGALNTKSLQFEFKKTTCALLQALKAGKTVLLKGHFSNELADKLAPLLLDRHRVVGDERQEGKLFIVTDDEAPFYDLPFQHQMVNAEDKRTALAQYLEKKGFDEEGRAAIIEKLTAFLEEEGLSQLLARAAYLIRHPQGNTEEAWYGLESLGAQDSSPSEEWYFLRSARVRRVLEAEPYVFLTGLTGVGKSTFVEKALCGKKDRLYVSETKRREWAEDKSTEGFKILFIDEANLSDKSWQEFEGLFHTPPGILIEGDFYPLSSRHKVVFAGNPLSYGDERRVSPLFLRHGNAVLFKPLPASVLEKNVLQPVFEGRGLEASVVEDICRPFLDVYDFVCSLSERDVLISPRELQMMALLTASHTDASEETLQALASHFAHQLGRTLVTEEQLAEFDERFKSKLPSTTTVIRFKSDETSGDFLITPSRQSLQSSLHDLLRLREWRREVMKTSDETNTPSIEAKSYGGLGGMVIEGTPGIGKSELVLTTLIAQGYEEEHDLINLSTKDKPFYRMPVSMTIATKRALLLKAFDEGAVVIIDEINASPMLERLLNDLLMGKTPEGKRPKKTGFLVIGTQNPVSMAGRRQTSTALKRRLINTTLPDYTELEMQTILENKGLSTQEATTMVKAYLTQLNHAKTKHLSPLPCFRDLLKLANEVLKAQRLSVSSHPDIEAHSDRDEKSMQNFFWPKVVTRFQFFEKLEEINDLTLKVDGDKISNSRCFLRSS